MAGPRTTQGSLDRVADQVASQQAAQQAALATLVERTTHLSSTLEKLSEVVMGDSRGDGMLTRLRAVEDALKAVRGNLETSSARRWQVLLAIVSGSGLISTLMWLLLQALTKDWSNLP